MWNLLKQSTAKTVKVGAFLDSGDGNTQETALSIAQADIRLSKDEGDFAQTHNAAGATHDEVGWYDVPLDTTDTDTIGSLIVAIHKTGALVCKREFVVVSAAVYDFLRGTAAPVGVGSGTGQLNVSGGKAPATVAAGDIATDAITAAAVKADAVTKIQAGLATSTVLTTVKELLDTTAVAELAADPGATPAGVIKLLMLLYMKARNAETVTASEKTVKNDAGATILTHPLADDGTTFTKGKVT